MTMIQRGTWAVVEVTQPYGRDQKATPHSDKTLELWNAAGNLTGQIH